MKLSIIIPVYRTEDTLSRCMESIVGQTFGDWEAILVDDGSPDGCPLLCDEWARRDPRISVIHKPNGGLSDARNAGIDVARGDYLTFVDSDDYLDTGTYASLLPFMEQGIDVVEFSLIKEGHGPLSLPEHTYTDMGEYWLQGHAYEHTYACNKLFRREALQGARFPVGHVFEDVAFLPQVLRQAHKAATVPQGCYHYCLNPQGITHTATGNDLQQLLEHHLAVMPHWCDDRYYMHVLNIQADVCEQARVAPTLPFRRVNPWGQGLSPQQRLKAATLSVLGLSRFCQLNQTLHKICKHPS